LGAARTLREIAPTQPLLLAVPPANDVSAEALADAGISEVLQQPLVSAELAAALVRTLQT
jgi:BarA-like signal transduction histidine kinase